MTTLSLAERKNKEGSKKGRNIERERIQCTHFFWVVFVNIIYYKLGFFHHKSKVTLQAIPASLATNEMEHSMAIVSY